MHPKAEEILQMITEACRSLDTETYKQVIAEVAADVQVMAEAAESD